MFWWGIALLIVAAITVPITIKFYKKVKRVGESEIEMMDGVAHFIVGVVAVLSLAAGVTLHVLSYFIYVPVNTIAVIVDTGKPVAVVGSGLHSVKPWQTSVEFDASRQFLYFVPEAEWGKADENPEDEYFRCPIVRLASVSALSETEGAGGSTACIVGTIEWQMKADTEEARALALQLYKDYKTFPRVRTFFLSGTARTVFGDVFKLHNPLSAETNQSTSELNEMNLVAIREIVGSRLNIQSVNLGVPDYNEITDQALSDLQAEKARTATALQAELTAEALARAADDLADVPGAYVQLKCIEAALSAIDRGQPAEPGLCMMSSDNQPIVNAS